MLFSPAVAKKFGLAGDRLCRFFFEIGWVAVLSKDALDLLDDGGFLLPNDLR